jgi:long-chain acyl-CoA synthetase
MTFDADRYRALLPLLIAELVVAELRALRPAKFESLSIETILESEHWTRDFTLDSLERVTLSSMVAEYFNVYDSGREDTLLGIASAERWADIVALSRAEVPTARDITFRSSGSAGKPKLFRHQHDWLVQEATHWATQMQALGVKRIVSCVPPQHIYGYLWAVLLPVIANIPVQFLRGTPLLQPKLDVHDALVATPRLFEQWASRNVGLGVAHGVCSTGRLEAFTSEEICARTELADLWEIYGSSETAGLAMRARGAKHYTWLPHLTLEKNETTDVANTPAKVRRRLPNATDALLNVPDAINTSDDIREFTVGDRHDEIVKVFGKRIDLEALRTGLRSVAGVADANVRLFTDAHTAALKVFIVPRDLQEAESVLFDRCRAWVAANTDAAPAISSWRSGAAIPVNAMGKLVDW